MVARDDLYYCPSSGAIESGTDGGFGVCCSAPQLHVCKDTLTELRQYEIGQKTARDLLFGASLPCCGGTCSGPVSSFRPA